MAQTKYGEVFSYSFTNVPKFYNYHFNFDTKQGMAKSLLKNKDCLQYNQQGISNAAFEYDKYNAKTRKSVKYTVTLLTKADIQKLFKLVKN